MPWFLNPEDPVWFMAWTLFIGRSFAPLHSPLFYLWGKKGIAYLLGIVGRMQSGSEQESTLPTKVQWKQKVRLLVLMRAPSQPGDKTTRCASSLAGPCVPRVHLTQL